MIVWGFVQRRRTDEAYAQLVASSDWSATTTPLGWDADQWVTMRSLPRGDRRFGISYAVVGPQVVDLVGRRLAGQVAVFGWWWESRSTDSEGRTTYTKRSMVVAAARLPMACPPIAIGDEGVLTKLGIGGRRDMQVESDEFNRRFEVQVPTSERPVAIRLLDAAFQHTLLARCRGREVELVGEVFLLGGRPGRRDPALFGDLAWYPAARAELLALLDDVPASFWRAVLRPDGAVAGPASHLPG